METFEYVVASIDGDYAHLKRADMEDGETKMVARALLPPEIVEGSRLRQEFFEYTIAD